MSKHITLNNNTYVSAKSAGTAVGYTSDYVGKLCRNGDIACEKVGRSWYVDTTSLQRFVQQQLQAKELQRRELAQERKQEYERTTDTSQQKMPKKASQKAVVQNTETIATTESRHTPDTSKRKKKDGGSVRAPGKTTSPASTQRYRYTPPTAIAQPVTGTYFRKRIVDADANTRALMVRAPLVPMHTMQEMLQRATAFVTALVLVFGTYTIVRAELSGGAGSVARDAATYVARTVHAVPDTIVSFDAFVSDAFAAVDDATRQSAVAQVSGASVVEVLHNAVQAFAMRMRGGTPEGIVVTQEDDTGVVSVQVRSVPAADAPSASTTQRIATSAGATSTPRTSDATPTVIEQTIVNHPVVERIIETQRVIVESGVTLAQLQQTENELRKEIAAHVSTQIAQPAPVPRAFSFAQRIDTLGDVDISNSRITNSTLGASSLSVSGTSSFTGAATYTGYLATQFASDYATTGAQDDVNLGSTSAVRYTGAGTATFTGVTGGVNGRILYVHNDSASALTLSNDSGSSTAANRILTGTGSDLAVAAGSSIVMQYDATESRWRVVGGSGGGGGATTFADLTDTDISSPAGGQLSVYDGTDSWNNVTLSGDATLATNGALTVSADAVALGTDTTGNYLATLADAGNSFFTVSGSGSESAAVTLDIANDSLNFAQLADALVVDATTTFDLDTNGADLNFDSNTFFIDSSANRIGIGTSDPAALLEVEASVANALITSTGGNPAFIGFGGGGAVNAARVGVSGGLNGLVVGMSADDLGLVASNNDIFFSTANGGSSAQMIIDSSGNVGIGTIAPGSILSIGDGSTTGGKSIHVEDHGDAFIFLEADEDNSGENDNAYIKFSQDNASSQALVGLVGNGGVDPEEVVYSGTLSNALLLGTTNVNALQLGTADAVRVTVDTNGNAGIGVTNPDKRLEVFETVADAQLKLSYDSSRYAQFQVNSVGDLIVDAQGGDVSLNNENFFICTGGSCPAGTPAAGGSLTVESAVGVGVVPTTAAQMSFANSVGAGSFDGYDDFKILLADAGTAATSFGIGLETDTLAFNTGSDYDFYIGGAAVPELSINNATSTFQGDVVIAGKLDVGTIDPVYTIDGVKYATYGHSTIGIKEEATSVVHLHEKNTDGMYEVSIPFGALAEGSDMWLFYQVTNFGNDWEKLVVSLTPSFDGRVFYEKDVDEKTLRVKSRQSGEVSLRLVADRYDADTWPTIRPDQGTGYMGHIIDRK